MNLEGKNQKSIRIENLMQALRIIAFQGPCSRKELTQQMGLTKMSITNIVNTFLSRGLVTEVEIAVDQHMSSGPRPFLLKIATGKLVAIGIHITEYSINGQLYDMADGVLLERKIVTESIHSKAYFLSSIKQLVDELMEYQLLNSLQVVAIGITDDYFINRVQGSVSFKGNQLGIDINFIRSNLEQKYQVPIYIENMHIGILLTEMAFGFYDSNKKYYFLSISDEIRGAFTSEYYIQKGCVGLSGMVGHMSIKFDGPRCSCGNRGCYENYGNIAGLLRDSNCSSIEELNNNLANREPLALRALENFIQVTTIAITNIVNLYDPEIIVVGGNVLKLDKSILKKIEYLVNDSFVFRKQRTISIIPSTLTEYHHQKGAAIMAVYQMTGNKDYVRMICEDNEQIS